MATPQLWAIAEEQRVVPSHHGVVRSNFQRHEVELLCELWFVATPAREEGGVKERERREEKERREKNEGRERVGERGGRREKERGERGDRVRVRRRKKNVTPLTHTHTHTHTLTSSESSHNSPKLSRRSALLCTLSNRGPPPRSVSQFSS